MTADVNWGSGGQSDEPDPPAAPSRRDRGEPPALQVKSPAPAQSSPAPLAGTESGRLEFMLQRLMERLDDSERRYGEALDDLHERLDGMAQQPDAAASEEFPYAEAEADLESVEARARQLAERLRHADAAQEVRRDSDAFSDIEQRISDFARQMAIEHDPAPDADMAPTYRTAVEGELPEPPVSAAPAQQAAAWDLGLADHGDADRDLDPTPAGDHSGSHDPADLEDRFKHISAQLEDSLTGSAFPGEAAEVGAETRPEAPPPADAPSGVEPHEEAVAAAPDLAEAQNQRLDAIEGHLARLVEMTQVAGDRLDQAAQKAAQETVRLYGGERDWTVAAERLDVIQKALHALNERARHMDERSVGTLEAMNEALGNLAAKIGPQDATGDFRQWDAQDRQGTPRPQDSRLAEAADLQPQRKPQPASSHKWAHGAGALLPPDDDAPQPPAPDNSRQGDTRAQMAPSHTGRSSDQELVAAARRAAQEAARRSPPAPREPGLMARWTAWIATKTDTADASADGRKPRRLLVFAAVFLLIVSAALLYGRLQTKPPPAVPSLDGQEQTVPPVQQAPEEPGPRNPDAGSERRGGSQTDPAAPKHTATAQLPRTLAVFESVQPSADEPAERLAAALPGTSVQFTDPTPPTLPARDSEPASARDSDSAQHAEPPEASGSSALRAAAERGDAQAQFEFAARLAGGEEAEPDFAEAARWYERAANQGLASAQFRLASLYERGQGVAEDPARAKLWYTRAAEQGNVNAMHNLAVMQIGQNGEGPNYADAAAWFERAAAHGLADSQFNLGVLYESGLGVPRDLVKSYKWFMLAAANGDAEAARRGAQLKSGLSAGEIEEAEAEVRQWSPQSPDREANLGIANEAGGAGAVQPAPGAPRDDPDVQRAQALLNGLGFDAGTADGILGPRTREAIRAFERRAGLAPTGEVTGELLSALEAFPG